MTLLIENMKKEWFYVSIQDICYGKSWYVKLDNNEFQIMFDEETKELVFQINNVERKRFSVDEYQIQHTELRNGGYVPYDRAWVYYIRNSNKTLQAFIFKD